MTFPGLPIEPLVRAEDLMATERVEKALAKHALEIGRSRAGRPLFGFRTGTGATSISLIGGCHADEPVGPAMLRRLVLWLLEQDASGYWRSSFTWSVVPHANPDGEAINRAWSRERLPCLDAHGQPDRGFSITRFLSAAVRETPPDDVEFGFPRSDQDDRARPENRSVARFLEPASAFALHATFHGLSTGVGPWFLLEPAWIDRTAGLRESLRSRVRSLGYRLLDVDRGGEKGFSRIDPGFSTRPDSEAMRSYFLERGDRAMASAFRPSSMEWVRARGGDPLTFVSEMPLFLAERTPEMGRNLRSWLLGKVDRSSTEAAGTTASRTLEEAVEEIGLRPMPIRDQMRLQLALLEESLRLVVSAQT